MRWYVTFNKWDIFWNLWSTTPEAVSWDAMIPHGDPITPPTTADAGDMESSSTEAQRAHNTTPLPFRYPPEEETPAAEPITWPTKVDVKDIFPGPADNLQGQDAMVLLTKSDMGTQRDLLTGWDISPIEVETQLVPTTGLVVELADPLTPSNQAKEERWCMLIVTASIGRLNLEVTGLPSEIQ